MRLCAQFSFGLYVRGGAKLPPHWNVPSLHLSPPAGLPGSPVSQRQRCRTRGQGVEGSSPSLHQELEEQLGIKILLEDSQVLPEALKGETEPRWMHRVQQRCPAPGSQVKTLMSKVKGQLEDEGQLQFLGLVRMYLLATPLVSRLLSLLRSDTRQDLPF